MIDIEGFYTAELRELRGKDFQQVLMFADKFTIGIDSQVTPVPLPAAFWLFSTGITVIGLFGTMSDRAGIKRWMQRS